MFHKLILAGSVTAAVMLSAGVASAMPLAPLQAADSAAVIKVTFWGKPFPYGYRWRAVRACSHLETVETSRGPVSKRVWTCGSRDETVVSYKG